ncbi:MAG: hypothetical protein ABIO81_11460 [Ginsengibacter sp.]
MKKFIIPFLFIAGCNSSNQKEDYGDTIVNDSFHVSEKGNAIPTVISGCYAWGMKRDSALLKLDISGNKITGDLSYKFYEKDNNLGKIDGILEDSLIFANYTFQSEGMTSVREVIFKIRNDSLLEGFGEIVMSGDTAKFKYKNQVQFQNKLPFKKINCK